MKHAFTLIELLVVIGIMGLLGTVSVGGYRAMQRGMEERGVIENANTFFRAAYERAQIDRQPTAVFYWNETIRAATMDENEIVVGRAVAVRRQGRISAVEGDLLIDEFADLERTYRSPQTMNQSGTTPSSSSQGDNLMFLYKLDNQGGSLKLERSVVYDEVESKSRTEVFLQGRPTDNVGSGELTFWGFRIKDKNGVNWQTGSAYGFEFAEMTLPHNYIFGNQYSKDLNTPVQGENAVMFSVVRITSLVSGSGVTGGVVGGMPEIRSLQPDGSGGLRANKVGTVPQPGSRN